ncbi:unnamed protein product [Lactuca virosa]|uniref:Dirigent protein n=1 Tax=Lactuca virosa TaxID=75947 RepID=A0AAU9MTE0_9ASTR|nr:unnamed protein product [Lactuca virosa]
MRADGESYRNATTNSNEAMVSLLVVVHFHWSKIGTGDDYAPLAMINTTNNTWGGEGDGEALPREDGTITGSELKGFMVHSARYIWNVQLASLKTWKKLTTM